jgi:hypothetical protein
MTDWINCNRELPPFYKRVLIWTKNSNLLDWNRKFIQSYVMDRRPERVDGNHQVPYSYRCENGGLEWGHNVTHWSEVEPPND